MLVAGLIMGGVGALAAIALGVAAKVFAVEVDPLVQAIEEALPGANCGGCGQAGCASAAEAIAHGRMSASGCVAGGPAVREAIAAIMGVEVKEVEPEIARVGCRYPIQRADVKYDYVKSGITDCRAAMLLYGGPKECPVGCIGLGSCVKACPFDALAIGPDGLPVVNEAKCTGCGTCVRTCPVGIMKLTSVTDRVLQEYSWSECTAPCQRRCPAGINIPEQIRLTAKGDYGQALSVIKERNPLPLICGRICPAPCEVECRRNLADEPVAINNLKRFVADRERESGQRVQPYKAPPTGRKAAVIGGGVQGLSAAYFLARLGHSPAIFESRKELGGLLRTSIPESRLPREVLDWEIEGILALGVEAFTGRGFGADVTLSSLFDQGYEIVLQAVGGWDASLLTAQNPAPALPGLYLMLPLSLAWAAGRKVELGHHVAVAGCGKEAVMAARRSIREGAADVTILCPSDGLGVGPEELDRLAGEPIKVLTRARVTAISGVGDRLTGLSYAIGSGSERELGADAIIAASGRVPEMIIYKDLPEQAAGEGAQEPVAVSGAETPWRAVVPYTPYGLPKDLFADRKPVSDYWWAVEAIGAGRRAAATMHKLLWGESVQLPADLVTLHPGLLDVDHLENLAEVGERQIMPEASPKEQLDPYAEVELGLGEEAAVKEAGRCLNCGLICYYRTQYH